MNLRTALFLLFSGLFLTACGGGDDSLDGLGKGGGTTQTPDNDVNDDGVDDTPDNPLSIRVFVEATGGMSGDSSIGSGERFVDAAISVQQIAYDGEMSESGVVLPSDYSVVEERSGESYLITFSDQIPARMDLVIVATLASGDDLRTWLPRSNEAVTVDIFSEYVVREFYSAETFDSQAELDDLVGCGGSSFLSCANLALADLEALFSAVQEYSISIDSDDTINEAIAELNTDRSLELFVATYIREVKTTTLAQSTDGDVSPVLVSRIGNYNVSYFSLGINQIILDNVGSEKQVLFTNRSSTEKSNENTGTEIFTYPELRFGASRFASTITRRVPWRRHALRYVEDNDFQVDTGSRQNETFCIPGDTPIDNESRCFLGSILTFLSPEGYLQSAAASTQAITSLNSTDGPFGWEIDPYFQYFYSVKGDSVSALASPSLASTSLSVGSIYKLVTETSGDSTVFRRATLKEEINSFAWTFASLQTIVDSEGEAIDFTLDTLNGEDYGVVYLTQDFSSTTPLTLRAGTQRWQVGGDRVNVIDTLGANNEHLAQREVDGSATLTDGSGFIPGEDLALLSSIVPSDGSDDFNGRIALDSWEGMSDPNGNILSLVQDPVQSGETYQGLLHAIKITDSIDLSSAEYELYGHAMAIEDDAHRLSTYNFSTLTFDETEQATLTLQENFISQLVGTTELATLQEETFAVSPTTTPSRDSNAGGNYIRLDFPDPSSSTTGFELEGYVASEGNLLVLHLKYGDQLGLVYGYKKQSLTTTSE